MTVSQSKPNDKQVGGTHYQDCTGACPECGAKIQHWDLFGQLPYLIGYATKEIMRHRLKEGKLGLEKAKHIIDKIIEQEYPDPPQPLTPEQIMLADARSRAGVEAAKPDPIWSGMVPKVESAGWIEVGIGEVPVGHKTGQPDFSHGNLLPLDNSPEAVRARADAFAAAKPDDDVPIGWVLKSFESGDHTMWHFRRGNSGDTRWGVMYFTREEALAALQSLAV